MEQIFESALRQSTMHNAIKFLHANGPSMPQIPPHYCDGYKPDY